MSRLQGSGQISSWRAGGRAEWVRLAPEANGGRDLDEMGRERQADELDGAKNDNSTTVVG